MNIERRRTWTAGIVILALLAAGAAFAGYNGVEVDGVNDSRIASGSVTISGVGTFDLETPGDCENDPNRDPEDECDDGAGFLINTDGPLPVGADVSIVVKDPDGNTTTGSGTVTQDGTIKVKVSPFPGSTGKDDPSDRRQPGITFGGNAGRFETPDDNATLGFVRIGVGNEIGLTSAVRYIDTAGFDVEIEPGPSVPIGGTRWNWVFGVQSFSGDETARNDVEIGTLDTGYTHLYPSPVNGSTGVDIGNNGGEAWVTNDVDHHQLRVSLAKTTPCRGGLYPVFGIGYGSTEQSISGAFTSPSFTGINEVSARLNQTIEDELWSVHLGFERPWALTDRIGVNLGAYIEPGYQQTDVSGGMEATCLLCPAARQQLEFPFVDDESNFDIGGGVNTKFTFDLSDRMTLNLGAVYHVGSTRGRLDNPENPNQGEVRLETESYSSFSGQFGFTVNF